MNPTNAILRLQQMAEEAGALSVAVLRMDNPLLRKAVAQQNQQMKGWLKEGQQGEMAYLTTSFPLRSDPWRAFPFAHSVVVVSFNADWGDLSASHPFPSPAPTAPVGYISAYARGIDYHRVGRELLEQLRGALEKDTQSVVAVDTQPVYERIFAWTAGLGIRGANGLLRTPQAGVRVFIGCLFVEQELPEQILTPVFSHSCADCEACQYRCPTRALGLDGVVDARRCISYLTIEKRSPLSREEGEMIGDWIFGCDVCTTACPPCSTDDLRIPVDLEWLLKTPSGKLRRALSSTSVAYAGVTQLRKNAVVLLKKSEDLQARKLLRWVTKNTGSELIRQQIHQW